MGPLHKVSGSQLLGIRHCPAGCMVAKQLLAFWDSVRLIGWKELVLIIHREAVFVGIKSEV